jgi:predicted nucleic acid-binding protein
MTLSWLVRRMDSNEFSLSQRAFDAVRLEGALVPGLWYFEVGNTLLVYERARRLTQRDSEGFLAALSCLKIEPDWQQPSAIQSRVLDLGRIYGLTVDDATYLELALRTGSELATFDRALAEAARRAGCRVFGDPV